jgi:hypothetical protein
MGRWDLDDDDTTPIAYRIRVVKRGEYRPVKPTHRMHITYVLNNEVYGHPVHYCGNGDCSGYSRFFPGVRGGRVGEVVSYDPADDEAYYTTPFAVFDPSDGKLLAPPQKGFHRKIWGVFKKP